MNVYSSANISCSKHQRMTSLAVCSVTLVLVGFYMTLFIFFLVVYPGGDFENVASYYHLLPVSDSKWSVYEKVFNKVGYRLA